MKSTMWVNCTPATVNSSMNSNLEKPAMDLESEPGLEWELEFEEFESE